MIDVNKIDEKIIEIISEAKKCKSTDFCIFLTENNCLTMIRSMVDNVKHKFLDDLSLEEGQLLINVLYNMADGKSKETINNFNDIGIFKKENFVVFNNQEYHIKIRNDIDGDKSFFCTFK